MFWFESTVHSRGFNCYRVVVLLSESLMSTSMRVLTLIPDQVKVRLATFMPPQRGVLVSISTVSGVLVEIPSLLLRYCNSQLGIFV